MTKAFNKGDKVTIIKDWDWKGTCSYQDAVVYSCGKKRMVLTCEQTGEELGRNFEPVRGEFGQTGVFPRMSADQTIVATLSAAEIIIKNKIMSANKMLSQATEERYKQFWRKYLEEIHEPRAAHIDDLKRKVMEGA